MMSHLLTERQISPGDLDRLRAMLEERTAGKEKNSHAR
jgi:hypothetical protein